MELKISNGLFDLVENLNKLRNNIGDPKQQGQIQKIINDLNPRLEEEVRKQLDEHTEKYQGAVAELKKANNAVSDAMAGLNKVVQAIKTATEAAKAIDEFLDLCK